MLFSSLTHADTPCIIIELLTDATSWTTLYIATIQNSKLWPNTRQCDTDKSQSKYEKSSNCTGFNCCLVTGFVVKSFGQSFNGRRHQTLEKHYKCISSPFGDYSQHCALSDIRMRVLSNRACVYLRRQYSRAHAWLLWWHRSIVHILCFSNRNSCTNAVEPVATSCTLHHCDCPSMFAGAQQAVRACMKVWAI